MAAVLRENPFFCAQGLLLEVLGGPYAVAKIEPELALFKASTFFLVLSLSFKIHTKPQGNIASSKRTPNILAFVYKYTYT